MASGRPEVGFIADASATLPWCFEDKSTPATEGLLERLRKGEAAIVPAHWSLEVMKGSPDFPATWPSRRFTSSRP